MKHTKPADPAALDSGESPAEYKGLHRALLFVAAFFFLYLILESVFLIPTLFVRYGFH